MQETYRDTLATLQANAPPMDYDLAARVVREDLGRHPEEAFAWFDREPLAAASIGQVHAARTHEGQDVVVKVQYPGVADAMQADLDNCRLLYRMVSLVFPQLDPAPLVAEIRARLGEELDYRFELRNQERFLGLYRGHPFIHVPEVVPVLCTQRVLTMERIGDFPGPRRSGRPTTSAPCGPRSSTATSSERSTAKGCSTAIRIRATTGFTPMAR